VNFGRLWLVLAVALPTAAQARMADLAVGRDIALHGSGAGAQACAACHKLDGTGDSSGAFPRLTGQGAFYLYKQLKDYAAGSRESQIMVPVAQRLTDTEMQDVAGWYAAANGTFVPPQSADPAAIRRGGVLAAAGSVERNIPACANCHGAAGAGMPPSFPYLAGQFARYTVEQFAAWRDGSRRNDPLDLMRDIAARLTDDDVTALAAYFAQVSPPERPAVSRQFPEPDATGSVGAPGTGSGRPK
jgi:cytochrome c553